MKKGLIILSVLLLGALTLLAGNPLKHSRMSLETIRINIGDQPYKLDSTYTFQFPYRNEGEGELIISRVIPGCYCVVPEFSKNPLKMGQMDTITVKYIPYRSGRFRQMLTVCTNDPRSLFYITIVGDLKEQ